MARARQAIADVDERTRAAEKKFAEFERDHAVKVSKMEHEAAENARRLEAKLLEQARKTEAEALVKMRDANEKEARITHDLEKIKQMETLRAEATKEIASEREEARKETQVAADKIHQAREGLARLEQRKIAIDAMETSADERIRVHLADAESKAKSAEHSLAEAKRDLSLIHISEPTRPY